MKSLQQRINEKVDRSGGPDACWPWQACCNAKGYGNINVNDKTRLAHAVVLELHTGEKANGRHALHRCDNPPCCNPEHLFWGSNTDNIEDRVKKGRSMRGEAVASSVLTPEQVLLIRSRYVPYSREHGTRAIAREFGVCNSAISQAVLGKTWRHV